jgi:hypothetical protein
VARRIGDNCADCSLWPSHQRNMGSGRTSDRWPTPCIGPSSCSCIYSMGWFRKRRRTGKREKPDHIFEPGRAPLLRRYSLPKSSKPICASEPPPSPHDTGCAQTAVSIDPSRVAIRSGHNLSTTYPWKPAGAFGVLASAYSGVTGILHRRGPRWPLSTNLDRSGSPQRVQPCGGPCAGKGIYAPGPHPRGDPNYCGGH